MQDTQRISKSITVENLFLLIAQMQREIAQDAASDSGPLLPGSGEEACLNAAEPGAMLLLFDCLLPCSTNIFGSTFCLSLQDMRFKISIEFDARFLGCGLIHGLD